MRTPAPYSRPRLTAATAADLLLVADAELAVEVPVALPVDDAIDEEAVELDAAEEVEDD